MTAKLLLFGKLCWLFAETLVIVLGVLIALGLDDYRTGQHERRLANDYLHRSQGDLKRDLDFDFR
jgi:hypothetical protein